MVSKRNHVKIVDLKDSADNNPRESGLRPLNSYPQAIKKCPTHEKPLTGAQLGPPLDRQNYRLAAETTA